jgi:hypothetical protein
MKSTSKLTGLVKNGTNESTWMPVPGLKICRVTFVSSKGLFSELESIQMSLVSRQTWIIPSSGLRRGERNYFLLKVELGTLRPLEKIN